MNFLDLLGKALDLPPMAHQEPVESYSSLESAMDVEGGVTPARCAVHRTMFFVANILVLAGRKLAIDLDTGGYCRRCQQLRCPRCSAIVEARLFGKVFWTPACGTCLTPYGDQFEVSASP